MATIAVSLLVAATNSDAFWMAAGIGALYAAYPGSAKAPGRIARSGDALKCGAGRAFQGRPGHGLPDSYSSGECRRCPQRGLARFRVPAILTGQVPPPASGSQLTLRPRELGALAGTPPPLPARVRSGRVLGDLVGPEA
ncbi:hypothetical protein C3B59_17115 [Cryobacterium zongtaii]|uniref:Uncharacterized protein n=1 Tax=Cryobacterium zongtaii TaxID=1259217 RepID=A0A2S3Z5Y6_9MICO|nr:hypothetical protein C3B59_17115 [Cryobacterium zongtaii]